MRPASLSLSLSLSFCPYSYSYTTRTYYTTGPQPDLHELLRHCEEELMQTNALKNERDDPNRPTHRPTDLAVVCTLQPYCKLQTAALACARIRIRVHEYEYMM